MITTSINTKEPTLTTSSTDDTVFKTPKTVDVFVAPIPTPSSSVLLLDEYFHANSGTSPYHVLSRRRIRAIVILVSLAAMLSPLSSSIYFPALDNIAQSLNISYEKATLSVTIFMIIQGIAPSIWGPVSDFKGRRIAFFGALIITLVANIGLLTSHSYPALMILRALQSGGSSATVAMSTGVIADLATAERKGGYISLNQNCQLKFYSYLSDTIRSFGNDAYQFNECQETIILTSGLVRQAAQSLGPALGGALTQKLGFRSIFAFLIALSGTILVTVFVFLPETQRYIAGNGSVPLHGVDKPLIYCIWRQPYTRTQGKTYNRQKLHWKAFIEPLKWLRNKDVICLLGVGGAVYTVQSMVTASQADIFTKTYQLNDLYLGLSFLPTGLGTIIGGQFKGWIMDRDMRAAQNEYRKVNNLPHDHTIKVAECSDFPLEKARLRWMPYIIAAFIAFTIGYGFSLRTHIAAPLVLQCIMGATSAAVLNINTTYMTDLFPGRSASAVALQNLVRCLMGAGGVAAVDPLVDRIGPGFTFLVAVGFVVLFAPLQWVGMRLGAQWRERRAERESTRSSREETGGAQKEGGGV